MKRIRAARPLPLLLLSLGAAPAFAQDAAPARPLPESALDEAIEVVARGYEASVATATPKVRVLDAADIERRQSLSVGEILSEVPGVYVLTDGPRGQFSRVFTRGAAGTQTLVLVDGIPQNDATTGGTFDFNDLSTAGVERIEVLSGSYGVLYGSEAIGGVISVTTRCGKGPVRGFLRAEGGSWSTDREVFGFGGGDDAFDFWVTLAHDATAGDRSHEDFRSNEMSSRFGFAISERVRADVSVRSVESRAESPYDFPGFGATTLPEDSNIDRDRDTLSTGLTVTVDWADWVSTRVTASYLRVESDFVNGTDGPELLDPDFTPGSGDEIRVTRDELLSSSEARDLRFGAATTFEVGRRAGWRRARDGGLDLDVTAGASTLDEASDSSSTSPNFNAPGATTTSIDRRLDTNSIFALAEVRLADHGPITRPVVSVGARRDRHDAFGSETSPYAGLRLDVAPTDTTLRASWGEGFRAPKPSELDDAFVGNADLGAETSESLDAGISQRFLGGDLEIGATWFRLDVEGLIAYDATAVTPTRPFGQLVNFNDVRTTGTELEGRYDAGSGVTLRAAFTSQNPRDRDTGAPLQNRARHFGSAGVSWERGGWLVSLDGTWSGVHPRVGGEFTDPDGDARKSPGRMGLITLGARWRMNENVAFFARVENLLDDDWVATSRAPAGNGRGVIAGFQLDF